MSRPHIGFVTTSFPTTNADFSGRFVFELARQFSRAGYRVDVVVPAPPVRPDWGRRADWLAGVRVLAAHYARPRTRQTLFFGSGVPDNLQQRPLRGLLIPTALFALVLATCRAARRWDAVMSHWLLPSALVAGTVRGRGIPHLAVAHSGDVHLLTHRLAVAAPVLLRSADRFGFISQSLERRFLRTLPPCLADRFASRSLITPMGIHPPHTRFDRDRDDRGRRFTVLFLGRLVHIKGVDLLIQAMSALSNAALVVAGEGPMRRILEQQARAGRVEAEFIGAIPPERRAELFERADALVLPSRTLTNGRAEGLPLVVLEAMAAGLPVVAARTGSIEELITHRENGLLFDEGSVPQLARAISLLRTSPPLRDALRRNGLRAAEGRRWSRLLPLFETALFDTEPVRARAI